MDDVAAGFIAEMKGRHPHLYGDGVKQSWEGMKASDERASSTGLPAICRAHRAFGCKIRRPESVSIGPMWKVNSER